MNALPKTTVMANNNGPQPRISTPGTTQSAGAKRMPVWAMGRDRGGIQGGGEALARSCEESALMLETIVDDFERIGWRDHSSYVQTMASHMGIYAHQIRGAK